MMNNMKAFIKNPIVTFVAGGISVATVWISNELCRDRINYNWTQPEGYTLREMGKFGADYAEHEGKSLDTPLTRIVVEFED